MQKQKIKSVTLLRSTAKHFILAAIELKKRFASVFQEMENDLLEQHPLTETISDNGEGKKMKALKVSSGGGKADGQNHAYMQALVSSAQLISEFRRNDTGSHDLRKDLHSWGYVDYISQSGANVVSHVEVLPGHHMSFDRARNEGHFISVVAGNARILINGELFLVREQECVFIPKGAKHVIRNSGENSLAFIQVNVLHDWAHQGGVNLN